MFRIVKASRQFWLTVSLLFCGGLALALVSTAWKANASAAALSASQKLLANDGAGGDTFGLSVALSGDTAIIGAIGDDTAQGAAYIFVRAGAAWTQQAKLQASDAAPLSHFGESVALSGDTAAVIGSGAVYVFVRTGTVWTQQVKLTIADSVFFPSVSLSGNYLAVSGGLPPSVGSGGGVFVFVRNGVAWSLQQILQGDDGNFGSAVAINDTTLAVGAVGDQSGYVFTRTGTTWSRQQKLTGSEVTAGHSFGASVALNGETLVVGAPLPGLGFGDQGQAYVFTRSGGVWSQQAKLGGAANEDNFYFGQSVAISGDTALIGSGSDDGLRNEAYPFTRSGAVWTRQTRLLSDNLTPDGDKFGISVALNGPTALVGASSERIGMNHTQGAAYVYILSNNPPPLIAPRTVTSYQGEPAFDELVATVTDDSNQPATVTVALNGALPAGITVNNLRIANFTVDAGGVVTGNIRAEVAAACSVAPGNYPISLQATDAQGGQSSASFTVTVMRARDAFDTVFPPSDQTVCLGNTASFTVSATPVMPNVQWQVSVNNGTFTNLTGATNSTLALPNVTSAQSGNRYRAVLTSSCQTATTNAATLTAVAAPVITMQPIPHAVITGRPVSFSVAVSGFVISYTWRKNGVQIPSALSQPTYTIPVTTLADAGTYDVVVRGGCEVTSAAATLAVYPGLVVNTTTDEDNINFLRCSLREAIMAARLNSEVFGCPAGMLGLDTIQFDLGSGTPTIELSSYPPFIALEPVIINGNTGGARRVVLNGAGIGVSGDGATGGTVIQSLVITNARFAGIDVFSRGTTIRDCIIGLDATGTVAQGNRFGIVINSGSSNCVIGGDGPNARNVISGNGEHGIWMVDSTGTPNNNNVIKGNYIGTNGSGAAAIGNGNGVFFNCGGNVGCSGGTQVLNNVISGNRAYAVEITHSNALVKGNLIGTDATGNFALGNGQGVLLFSANCVIGGTLPGERNVISSNVNGVVIVDTASRNTVLGNFIGTNAAGTGALGNTNDGVILGAGTFRNTLGGTAAGAGNRIAFNGQRGVNINAATALNNSVLGNSIYANGALGIDLSGDGVTANDAGDGDTGANNLQNYPVLNLATSNSSVSGTLNSTAANTAYPVRLEFFANTGCGFAGYGGGEVYLGFLALNAPGSFTFNFTPVSGKSVITATATDNNGNTSEFSAYPIDVLPKPTGGPAGSAAFALPAARVGQAYSTTISALPAGGNYGFTLTPSPNNLPNGLTLSSTGVISGTPTVTGNFVFRVQATGFGACNGSRLYSLRVNP